jgi:hypothetical protein
MNNYLLKTEKTGMVVYRTRNYGLFKTIESNRELVPSHIEQLKASIAKKGQYTPIIVKSNGEVLEGQHRLQVCKELNIPVYYLIRDLDISDISEMNSRSRNWKNIDYLHHWAKRGYQPYMRLLEIAEQHKDLGIEVSNLIIIFGNDGAKSLENFKNGKFALQFHDRGLKVLRIYKKIKNYCDKNPNNIFFRALAHLAMLETDGKFDIERFIKKLKRKSFTKPATGTLRDYLYIMETIYNLNERSNFQRLDEKLNGKG